MKELPKSLKDPKWQTLVRWCGNSGDLPGEILRSFIRENKIPKKHHVLAALALTVTRWGILLKCDELAGSCVMCVLDHDAPCSECLTWDICRGRDVCNPAPTFNRLHSLYKSEYEKEFGPS